VMDFPGPKPLDELIEDFLKGVKAPAGVSGELTALARTVVGERNWAQVRGAMDGLMQLRDQPVILMSPKVLMFK
jgi:hypothetical protein